MEHACGGFELGGRQRDGVVQIHVTVVHHVVITGGLLVDHASVCRRRRHCCCCRLLRLLTPLFVREPTPDTMNVAVSSTCLKVEWACQVAWGRWGGASRG